ncbi:hypothetical protein LTR17_007158 [Elasticomyces elasticus]|nr:hypothetical protein LTR17_007158 [Elasticomyces elasticus]
MADNAQPFRLLDLPAELRVRIYESFFEPDPGTPQEISLFDIQKHVPELAVLATSRLVRREAYPIGKTAEADFFARHQFVLDLVLDEARSQESPELQAAMTALPYYPITKMALRWYDKSRMYTTKPAVMYLTSEHLRCSRAARDDGTTYPIIFHLEQRGLLGTAPTRGSDGAYINLENVVAIGVQLAVGEGVYFDLSDRNIAELMMPGPLPWEYGIGNEDLYD